MQNTNWDYDLFEEPAIDRTVIDGKRHYKVPSGEYYPSVTTVLSSLTKEGILAWEKSVGKEEADKVRYRATTHGTNVHAIAEQYVRNQPIDFRKVMPSTAMAFKEIKPTIDKIRTIYGIEHPLFSHRLKTAGCTDLLCNMYGLNTVLDFKTSRKPKTEAMIEGYFLQTTCYGLMAYERHNVPFKQIAIVIACESDPPQVFVKLMSQYIDQTVATFKSYHANAR